MFNFEEEHIGIIVEVEDVLNQIEIALFTERYHLNRKHSSIFKVQSIAMIYSLWEGYMQQSLQLYIKYINMQDIPINELADSIVVFHMENSFKQFKQYPTKSRKKVEFFGGLKSFYEDIPCEIYSIVNTESNLSYEVLNRLMEQFCLQKFPEYWEKYSYPNPSLKEIMHNLLRYRNGIAHGANISNEEVVNQEVYEKYKTLVIDLMYGTHEAFIRGIETESFKKR